MASSRQFVMDDGIGDAVIRNRVNLKSLQELDETVASVDNNISAKLDQEQDGCSLSSYSFATQDGHSIYTHRHLIDNMNDVGIQRRPSKLTPLGSRTTRTSLRSKTTAEASQERYSGLERVVSQTILKTAALGSKSAHFLVSSGGKGSNRPASADYILKDLYQADSVIANEVSSRRSISTVTKRGRSRRRRKSPMSVQSLRTKPDSSETNLLPPMASQEEEDGAWLLDDQTIPSAWGKKSRDSPVTQNTPVDKSALKDVQGDDKSCLSVFSKNLFDDDDQGTFSSPTLSKSSQHTLSTSQSSTAQDVLQSDEWTSFSDNPFQSGEYKTFDDGSHDSPASIADFEKATNHQFRSKVCSPFWRTRPFQSK
jgi:hypothetical protein